MKTTLYVSGFNPKTRARNLAYEFERYGRLVRLDIPAPKSYSAKPYAFVEFEETRDADDAFQELNGRTIDGYNLSIQWARTNLINPHHSRPQHPPPHQHQKSYNRTSRSRSPYRRERSASPLPPRYNNIDPPRRLRSRSRSPANYQRRRSFSRSPPI
ncbi:hypothetical protein INT46_009162 [Mucor plumbeus]|uniref:RRM domain-containing protein n=1 Tax=Mucor plumbeus TaxID=97098 RepID=A0A8H7R4Q7_9FUNG|nr:hypothetical protein INT46_009162 [Mucor plumbeus]